MGQLRMLEALFGGETGHPVLAVGDPRQSIYGWRGASAGTIERFARTFPGRSGRRAERLTLATSWRNDGAVLAVANAVSAMLPARPSSPARPGAGTGRGPGRGHRRPLRDRRRRDRGAGRPAGRLLARHRRRPASRGRPPSDDRRAGPRPQAAATASRRPAGPRRAGRGRRPGRPARACPRSPTSSPRSPCSSTPTAGDALGRLLTGARWRIGPRDLAALEARARALVHSRRPASPTGGRRRRRADGHRSGRARQHRRGARRPRRPCRLLTGRLPPAAPARCRARPPAQPAGRVPARPRRRGRPHPGPGDRARQRPGGEPRRGPRPPRRAARRSPQSSPSWPSCPSLPAFLGYLRDAEERERGLEPGEVAVNPEAVQLLTGHSAKGLEWDVVAVPGHDRSASSPPRPTPATPGSRDPGAVPAELRLTDRGELPGLPLAGARVR